MILGIFQTLLLILCMSMFFVKLEKKIALIIVTSLLFLEVQTHLPFLPTGSMLLVVSCFVVSEFSNLKCHFKSFKGTFIYSIIIISLFEFLVHYVVSPHYWGSFDKFMSMFVYEEFIGYFLLIYSFICIKDEKSLKNVIKYTRYAIFVLTIFGVVNYITKESFVINALFEGRRLNDVTELAGNKFTDAERFRVQSLFFNPFDYGYVCMMISLFHLFAFYKKLESKKHFISVLICCIFGIVTCGSRSIILCSIVALIVILTFAFNLSHRIKNIVTVVILSIFVYGSVPFIQGKIDETASIFQSNKKQIQGSSIEGRSMQFAAVLYHIQGNELFGRGKGFYEIDMGWKDGWRGLKDVRMAGLEGLHMRYILEYGFVGYSIFLIIFISIIVFIYKKRKLDRILTAFGLSIVISYLCYVHMTSELSARTITFLLLGIVLKLMQHKTLTNLRLS